MFNVERPLRFLPDTRVEEVEEVDEVVAADEAEAKAEAEEEEEEEEEEDVVEAAPDNFAML